MKPRILIVDDNKDLARGVALVLSELAEDIAVFHSAREALDAGATLTPDVVCSDVRMPGMDGLELLDTVRERWPHARMILFTAFGTIDAAVDSMKRGAFHYLTKPFNDDELLMLVRRAWKERCDELELTQLREEVHGRTCFHNLHSRDRRMVPVIDTIRKVAPSPTTVLICGESGTGKELVARAIHAESNRKSGPFVAFNAAALSESLAEAELFGARRGAYTSADKDRKGLFVEAQGGTLFIDEVSSMPMSLQGRLLRALQEREVLPVGASVPVKVDVRIVAATNMDPLRMVTEGIIRKDLYYRLSVVRINIPPLRERLDDIPLLAQLFLEKASAASGGPQRRLTPRALRLLLTHDWPGNVRELSNVMERAAVLCEGDEIGPGDIQLEDETLDWQPDAGEGLPYEQARRLVLDRFQRRFIERLLAQTSGNMSAAARKAGVTRAALHRMTKRLGIAAREAPEPAAGQTPSA